MTSPKYYLKAKDGSATIVDTFTFHISMIDFLTQLRSVDAQKFSTLKNQSQLHLHIDCVLSLLPQLPLNSNKLSPYTSPNSHLLCIATKRVRNPVLAVCDKHLITLCIEHSSLASSLYKHIAAINRIVYKETHVSFEFMRLKNINGTSNGNDSFFGHSPDSPLRCPPVNTRLCEGLLMAPIGASSNLQEGEAFAVWIPEHSAFLDANGQACGSSAQCYLMSSIFAAKDFANRKGWRGRAVITAIAVAPKRVALNPWNIALDEPLLVFHEKQQLEEILAIEAAKPVKKASKGNVKKIKSTPASPSPEESETLPASAPNVSKTSIGRI